MNVEISGEGADLEHIRQDAQAVLMIMDRADAELSILLCNDSTIHELNRNYRGKDRPTDVLAFAQQEGGWIPGASSILGDVVISLDTAAEQAKARGHCTAYEIRVLLVHGICHLLGYDHELDEEAEEMEELERQILARLASQPPL